MNNIVGDSIYYLATSTMVLDLSFKVAKLDISTTCVSLAFQAKYATFYTL